MTPSEISKVTITPECIGCALCTTTAPEVFEMEGDLAVVIEGADLVEQESLIREAVENCPVNAIKLTE